MLKKVVHLVPSMIEVIDIGRTSDGQPVLGEKLEYANWYWERNTERVHKCAELLCSVDVK